MSNAKLDQLMESLRSAPTQTVQGVVYPSGVGASRSQGDELWHMTFSLAAWCIADGPIRRDRLLVRKDVADGEIDGYRTQLPDYGVIALELGVVESSAFPGSQALLHQIHPHQTCRPGLFEIAQAMRRPLTTDDHQFGTFTLDRRVNWHEAQTSWGETDIRLTLSSDRDDEAFPSQSLAHARRLWSEYSRWDRDVRDYIVHELLDLKNGSWLEEDEEPLTADQFLERISLESINVQADGSFEFWFNDGDTFWGHSIAASGSLEGGLHDAGIHG